MGVKVMTGHEISFITVGERREGAGRTDRRTTEEEISGFYGQIWLQRPPHNKAVPTAWGFSVFLGGFVLHS